MVETSVATVRERPCTVFKSDIMTIEQFSSTDEISMDKLKELDAYFDEQLKGNKDKEKKPGRLRLKGVIWGIAAILFSAFLPFILLIRGSIYAYNGLALNGWLSLLIGIIATSVLLMLYAVIVSRIFTKSYRVHKYIRRGILALVVAYCGYGLLYLSNVNTKSTEVQSYYSSLHPILRVSLATTILADGNLVLTDLQRSPKNYAQMGMAVRESSLHYQQESGYVHAADIRTLDRAEWKNWLIEKGFRLLGLKTLRHLGTADHLHVSLPPKN